MDSQDRVQELLDLISSNEKYWGCIFWGDGIYFTITDGWVTEMSGDASCSPRGGWFPDLVSGPSKEEDACMSRLMEKLGFDEYFFSDFLSDYDYFDEENILEYYEDNEDKESKKIYKKLKKEIESGKTPFDSMDDFVYALRKYGLESDGVYYEWEGEYIDLYDNIRDVGGPRGTYESMSDEEWIELLEHIDDHIVRG